MIAENILLLKQKSEEGLKEIAERMNQRKNLNQELSNEVSLKIIDKVLDLERIVTIKKDALKRQLEEDEALRKKKEAEDKELEELKKKLNAEQKEKNNPIINDLYDELEVAAKQSVLRDKALHQLEEQTVLFTRNIIQVEKDLTSNLSKSEANKYFKSKIDELTKKSDEIDAAIEKATQEYNGKQAAIEKIKTELTTKNTELLDLRDRLEAKKEELLAIKKEMDEVTEEISELNKQSKQNEVKKSRFIAKYVEMLEKVNQLLDEADRLKS